ncbi:MAG: sulfite exporter TauE/SafE family protein [Candidatus Aenigmarchaeota archaeon]|nr:sulfite exporter TauE/SafE family protein [Candidatus Aenigmarchaeota archaeon]
MDLMAFMETMGTSDIALVSAFFIGLMTAISPCPLATNITAIAYISKKIGNGKNTLMAGFAYTAGRMLAYIALASLIVYVGLNVQAISLFLQQYGEKSLGPLLIFIGLVMSGMIRLDFVRTGKKLDILKESLSEKGYLGSFGLGFIFALAFCPFSAVLYFGMLIPLALRFGDGILIPSVFAFATGLPVILFSFMLVYSVSKIGSMMDKVQIFEKYMRYAVSIIFLLIGIYYTVLIW